MDTSLGVVFIWFWITLLYPLTIVLVVLILPLFALLKGFVSIVRRIFV